VAEPTLGGGTGTRATGRATLALTLLFVLVAITVSAGLVVYTAWLHDLNNGPFAVLFAVLSAKATLSWLAWNDQDYRYGPSDADNQQKQD
jgi:hypothetical protein